MRPHLRATLQVLSHEDLEHVAEGKYRGSAHIGFDEHPREAPGHLELEPLRLVAAGLLYPGEGFDMHPHRGCEHLTVMISGRLRHRDTLGGDGLLSRGEVANFSAGRGASHSEVVEGDEPVEALTLVFDASEPEAPPRWHRASPPSALDERRWRRIATGRGAPPRGAVPLGQDAEVWAVRARAETRQSHELSAARCAYLLSHSAAMRVNGIRVEAGDRVIASGPGRVELEALGDTTLLLIDLAHPSEN